MVLVLEISLTNLAGHPCISHFSDFMKVGIHLSMEVLYLVHYSVLYVKSDISLNIFSYGGWSSFVELRMFKDAI